MSDVMKRLHVLLICAKDETEEKSYSIFLPALDDSLFDLVMHREVVNNDTKFLIVVNVNLFFKDLLHKELLMPCSKLFKHVFCMDLEGYGFVLI
jgi:hypothetical protein